MTDQSGACETVRRAFNLLTADVDGELLMMSVWQGRCFNLNAVGSPIWELPAAPITVAGMVDALTAEYESTPCRGPAACRTVSVRLARPGLLAPAPGAVPGT